ncbi:hypothetical protein C6P40_005506 [Pichia californica]|uniref:Rab-GAP TBC domain-containing protein n=1 Tax=Pichia californica TaxID=460514 RepID=A0A9P7BH79_9ASCO|nr:hypothetical protein C6P40_005506 [[Candida] californica]
MPEDLPKKVLQLNLTPTNGQTHNIINTNSNNINIISNYNTNSNSNHLTLNHGSLNHHHSRKSSTTTTNTVNSNTTYNVLDYYAEIDDDTSNNNIPSNSPKVQSFQSNHGSSTNTNVYPFNLIVNHSPTKSSHLKDSVIKIDRNLEYNDNQIKEDDNEQDDDEEKEEDKDEEEDENEDNEGMDGYIDPSFYIKQSKLTTQENISPSHITKHETLDSIVTSRENFSKFKKKINDIITIKENSSTSTFSSNFTRNKSSSQMKKSIKNSDCDRYGFKKVNQYITTKDYNDWWNEYCPHLIRRKAKWIKLLEKNGLYLTNNGMPSRFPVKSEEMSKFVKKGIPAEWRGQAWFSFVHGNERIKENKGLYEELVKQSIDLVNENTDAIEKDLHRTFPENTYFKNYTDPLTSLDIESPMLNTLRRVLKCFSLYKPTIGYCQSLNFITGLLLLFLNEEETFWMLVIITEKFLPGVHEANLEGLAVNQGMLLLCLKQHLPDVWKIIMDNDRDNLNDEINEDDTSYLFFLPTLTFCTTSWFMSLFIGVLPIETTLRIWDIIFYEDSKTIFQICLGIFKMLDPELRKAYCRAHGLTNSNSVVSQLSLHSDTDLNSIKLSSNNRRNSNLSENSSIFNHSQSSFNREMLSSELFQMIQNTPKRILNVNLFIEECFRLDSSTFCKLTQSEITRCRAFVISSRERHASLIEKRKELGMSQEERRELLRQERELSINGLGLRNVWNDGKNNHNQSNKGKRGSNGSTKRHSNDSNTKDNNNNTKNSSNNNNGNGFDSDNINNILNKDVMGKTGRGLRTAYWNVSLNRRIKKIYSKGSEPNPGF